MILGPGISVNARAAPLVAQLIADAAELGIGVSRGECGETLIDAGSRHRGSLDAGLRIAAICMGGLGHVRLGAVAATPRWPWTIAVRTSNPVIACLGSQYAGWRLSCGEGRNAYRALGSGPARAIARHEPLFRDIDYADRASDATLVIESDDRPPPALTDAIARDCGLAPDRLTLIFAPTQSLAGSVQVVARVLEVALHKAHALAFPLDRIVEGLGAAPLPPPHPDLVAAMGRTNDAIIYAGRVHLFVTGPAHEARDLATRLPSVASRDHGRPFAEIFARFGRDFYAVDPMLFSPAEAIVTALDSGETFRRGAIDTDLLDASFA